MRLVCTLAGLPMIRVAQQYGSSPPYKACKIYAPARAAQVRRVMQLSRKNLKSVSGRITSFRYGLPKRGLDATQDPAKQRKQRQQANWPGNLQPIGTKFSRQPQKG